MCAAEIFLRAGRVAREEGRAVRALFETTEVGGTRQSRVET